MANKRKRPQLSARMIWVGIVILLLSMVTVAALLTAPPSLTPEQIDATQTQLAVTALDALDSLFATPEATP